MSKSLLALPLFAAACLEPTYPELPETPTTPVETTQTARAGDAKVVIATGGVQGFAIDDRTSIGLEGFASDGYSVEPPKSWPNLVEPLYHVRAHESGLGSFEVITNHGIASGLVESAAIASIAIVPADYQLDGSSPFALDLARTDITIELRDAAGRRLVDASLGIPANQTAWDRATLPATAARHHVALYADSFGEHTVAIDVIDRLDRFESRVDGELTCFHAYAGTVEIATNMVITGGEPVPGAINCARGLPSEITARPAR